MAQAKKKTATKTAKKSTRSTCAKKSCKKSGLRYEKYERGQKSNMLFVVSASVLATALLIANLLFIMG
jgi:hypothetical protein